MILNSSCCSGRGSAAAVRRITICGKTFYETYIKRSIDFCGACAALAATALTMAATAVSVRVSLGSPVLYGTYRAGVGEKFR